MNDSESNNWKKCSVCKKQIPFATMYYVCSVSGCQSKRKGFSFCTVQCWDEHRADMNHRDAWAREARSPAQHEVKPEVSSAPRAPVKKIVQNTSPAPSRPTVGGEIKTDTLVVVSKVKKLIQEQSGFSTSQCGVDALTKKVVAECLAGIRKAKEAGRKTVMGRDIL